MKAKRIILLISFILWYIVTGIVIWQFIVGFLNGTSRDMGFVWYCLWYYLLTILLVGWSCLNCGFYTKLMGDQIFYLKPGGNGFLGWVFRVILGPIQLITFIAVDFKAVWGLIFNSWRGW